MRSRRGDRRRSSAVVAGGRARGDGARSSASCLHRSTGSAGLLHRVCRSARRESAENRSDCVVVSPRSNPRICNFAKRWYRAAIWLAWPRCATRSRSRCCPLRSWDSMWLRGSARCLVDRGEPTTVSSPGYPVITHDGVVGVVTATSDSRSQDDALARSRRAPSMRSCSAAALVASLRGRRKGIDIEFEFVVRDADVTTGDEDRDLGARRRVLRRACESDGSSELRDAGGRLTQASRSWSPRSISGASSRSS